MRMTNERDLSIFLLQEGLYLAATLPYTDKYIREQVFKYGQHSVVTLPQAIAEAVMNVHAGLGIAEQKQTFLISCIAALYKQHPEEKALHEALYMLRNILCNDAFKVLFKDIERKTSRIQSAEEAIAVVEQRQLIDDMHWHRYAQKQVAFLYHFITVLYEMRQITATSKGDAMTQYAAFASLKEAHAVTERQFTELALFQVVERDDSVTSALALLESYTIDTTTEQLIRRQGIHIEQLLATTYFSAHDVQLLAPYARTNAYVTLVVQTALLKLADEAATPFMPMKELSSTPPTERKVTPKQKPIKQSPPAQKELHVQKQALTEAQERIATLEKELQQQKAQHEATKVRLHETELQLENMTLEYEILQQEQQPHATALSLMSNIQTMMNELQQQLQPTEQVLPQETLAEALSHLKIAVVGGHQNFHQEMKKRLPAASLFIGPKELNFDERKLLNYDVVILAIQYCGHSLYERVFDYMKRHQAKQRCVITQHRNVEMIAEEIYYRFIA